MIYILFGLSIISDVQLVPPRPITYQEPESGPQREEPVFSDFETWTEVTGRRNKTKKVRIDTDKVENSSERNAVIQRPPPPPPSGGVKRRVPRKAAVAIKVISDNLSYSDVMKKAKEKINLNELGISNLNSRRAANGSVLIEIPGPEGHIKADTLANHLRNIIGDSAVVSRPVVRADLRIVGFDESVIKDEVITMITETGGLPR